MEKYQKILSVKLSWKKAKISAMGKGLKYGMEKVKTYKVLKHI